MTLPPGAKRAGLFCFGPMSHVTVLTHHVGEPGLSNTPVCIQVSTGPVKDLSDCKQRSRAGGHLLALILELGQGGLIL